MDKRLDSERRTLNRKFESIDIVINILKRGNEENCQESLISNIDGQLVLKSALILMYYNAIEGTMNNLINAFFDTIVVRNMKVSSLPKKLQKIYCISHLKKSNQEVSEDNIQDMIINHINDVRICDYKELYPNITFYSGNLDSQGIINVIKKLGFNLEGSQFHVSSLKIIKDKRNALAHGDVEFHEACRIITVEDMEKMRSDLNTYLYNLIDKFEIEINNLIQSTQKNV